MVSAVSTTAKHCAQCHTPPVPPNVLKTCSKCKRAYYCSVECQKKDWPKHKLSCQPVLPPSPEPTKTGYLRMLHVLLDAEQRELTADGQEITIAGCGLQVLGGRPHCPEVAAAVRLWSRSHFTILDSNQKVLDFVPQMNDAIATDYLSEAFRMNGSCMKPHDQLKVVQGKLTRLKPVENTMTLKRFRMGVDSLDSVPQSNVILATYSLMYPMQERFDEAQNGTQKARIALFSDYLAKLKPGGTLYVEQGCVFLLTAGMTDLLKEEKDRIPSPANIEAVLQKIRDKGGVSCQWRLLPMAIQSEDPDHEGDFYVFQPVLQEDRRLDLVQTSNAYAFTRVS